MSAVAELGIDHVRYPMPGDGCGSAELYIAALSRIAEAKRDNEQVLVHCYAGSRRSCGVTTCYRLLYQQRAPESIVEELAQFDWDHEEDHVLLRHLDEIVPVVARELADRGALDPKMVRQQFPRLSDVGRRYE